MISQGSSQQNVARTIASDASVQAKLNRRIFVRRVVRETRKYSNATRDNRGELSGSITKISRPSSFVRGFQ